MKHRLVQNPNEVHEASLTPIERFCKSVADSTGSPAALILAILAQGAWITLGTILHWDPFPFVFLLTCSNVLQLILIFVIAVAQKQSSQHAETRAELDHENISRLLHHQEAQEDALLKIAESTQADVSEAKAMIAKLAGR